MVPASVATPTRLVRVWRVVHRVAYAIWLGLLAVRLAVLLALIALIVFDWAVVRAQTPSTTPDLLAVAQKSDSAAERQQSLRDILFADSLASVTAHRLPCASGKQPTMTLQNRRLGARSLPDAADFCIAILTRLGREGALSPLRDTSGAQPTPALAFDSGFVAGFQSRGPLPSGAPTVASLKPVVERCLAQAEPTTRLCMSAGYVAGLRAAHGGAQD